MFIYYLVNIVDDYYMEIIYVICGEEWLFSIVYYVLFYWVFGWEDMMLIFVYLLLIFKFIGKGKFSKCDGVKLGIFVFLLVWEGDILEDLFMGFCEFGFDLCVVFNFLVFLGWNFGIEQEIFQFDELVQVFLVEKIGKVGVCFDFDKVKWFNQ